MKVNIRKFQAGGLAEYKPLPMLGSSQPATATKTEDDTLKEDLVEKMIGNGITSDVMAYSQKTNAAYKMYQSLPDHLKESAQGRMLRQQMKGDVGTLNAIRRSKERFDSILAAKKTAMPEYATFQGQVMVRDFETGDISTMGIGQYAQSLKSEKPQYKAITNSELALLREQDERFIGNDKVFGVLENGVSTEDVMKEIRQSLQNLGSMAKGGSDISYEEQRVAEGANGALQQGMSYIKTSEGEFKKTNAENLKMASNAMWANLSPASKDLLRVKAAHYGYTPEQIEGAAMGLAISLLNPALEEQIKENTGEVPGRLGGKTGSSDLKGKEGYYQSAVNFNGAQKPVTLVTGENSKVTIKGSMLPPLVDMDGKPEGPKNLQELKALSLVADMNNASFAGTKIPYEKLRSVIYDGKQVATVALPFKDEDGYITPDLELQNKLNDARKEIAKYGPSVPIDVKKGVYEGFGFNNLDMNGEPVIDLMPFFTFEGTTTDSVIKDPTGLMKLSEEPFMGSSDVKEWYKTLYTNTNGEVQNEDVGMFSSMVQGMVYIPFNPGSKKSSMFADKVDIKTSEAYNSSRFFNKEGVGFNQDVGYSRQATGGFSESELGIK